MPSSYQRGDGTWAPLEPLAEPFGVLWGRLWHERRRDGERRVPAIVRSFIDARAISRLTRG